jgi:hypothetical protein
MDLSLLPRSSPSKPELLEELLQRQMLTVGENLTASIEQPFVVGSGSTDALAKGYDLAVQVVELATRTALETR